jgi:glycosyltransferase involved in cell wall biosynthesis
MLASFFPKPGNPLMGTWALSQAQALARRMDVEVVSLNSWVPRWLAGFGHAAAYASCPPSHRWGSLDVSYPRALWYPVAPLKQSAYRKPATQMRIAWQSARGFLEKTVDRFKPDVVYAHHTAANGYLASRLNEARGIPFVVTDHDFGEIADCERFPERRRFFDEIIARSSMMVAVASRMEQCLRRLFPGAHACSIPNGTDEIPERVRSAPRPPEFTGKTVVFACGAFYERKGFPLLIEAFAHAAERFPDAILRIAGDGDQRSQVEERIRHFGLGDRVQLLGFLPHAQVMQEMCWSDIFALIGWDEPFATVFSEAMSAGKPVVCANDGGITDVLKNEVHGITIPPRNALAAAEALTRLLASPALRERMGRAGAELFGQSLRWDHNAARMEDLFRTAAWNAKKQAAAS